MPNSVCTSERMKRMTRRKRKKRMMWIKRMKRIKKLHNTASLVFTEPRSAAADIGS